MAVELLPPTLKLSLFRNWIDRIGISIGSAIRLSFHDRGAVICRFDVLLDDEGLLAVRAIRDEALNLPVDATTGSYIVPISSIRMIEKAPDGRKRNKSKGGKKKL